MGQAAAISIRSPNGIRAKKAFDKWAADFGAAFRRVAQRLTGRGRRRHQADSDQRRAPSGWPRIYSMRLRTLSSSPSDAKDRGNVQPCGRLLGVMGAPPFLRNARCSLLPPFLAIRWTDSGRSGSRIGGPGSMRLQQPVPIDHLCLRTATTWRTITAARIRAVVSPTICTVVDGGDAARSPPAARRRSRRVPLAIHPRSRDTVDDQQRIDQDVNVVRDRCLSFGHRTAAAVMIRHHIRTSTSAKTRTPTDRCRSARARRSAASDRSCRIRERRNAMPAATSQCNSIANSV